MAALIYGYPEDLSAGHCGLHGAVVEQPLDLADVHVLEERESRE